MAIFEGYERRIDQIMVVLKSQGIESLEEAKKICDDKGIDVQKIVKKVFNPFALIMLIGLILWVQHLRLKRAVPKLLRQLKSLVKGCKRTYSWICG